MTSSSSDGSPVSLEESLRIDSDVQAWNRHPNPDDTHRRTIGFPLDTGGGGERPFRCTQSENGQLTHFFSGNLHAVDFACPVGTPLVAVADGVVIEANDRHRLTGISVANLFKWNSILMEVEPSAGDGGGGDDDDGPLFVEYVHIETSDVKKGDRVKAGQRIGSSGSVGFSPEPHLHFACYRSQDPAAPTVRIYFHPATAATTDKADD